MKKIRTNKATLCGILVSFAFTASAVNKVVDYQYISDLKLSNKLIDYASIDLKDLAVLQLNRMKKQYPSHTDEINLVLAKGLQLSRQFRSFDAVIAEIGKNSPFYDDATLLKASQARSKGNKKSAITFYKDFFAKHAQPGDASSDIARWTKAATLFAKVLNSTNNAADAQEAIKVLAQVGKLSKKSGDSSAYRSNILAQSRLAIASIESGTVKNEDRAKKVEEVLELLKKNTFHNDFIAVLSYFEMARAKLAIKDFKGTVTLIKQISELMVNLEEALIDNGKGKTFSPVPGGFYYYGKAYAGLAEDFMAKGNSAKAIKAYGLAMKKFTSAISNYPDSTYSLKALASMTKIGAIKDTIGFSEKMLTKYAAYLTGLAVSAEMSYGDGMNKYRSKDYKGAIESFKIALGTSVVDKTTPDALYFYIQSLLKTSDLKFSNSGKCWEVEAIADFLTSDFASSDMAANICATLGSRYASESKKAKEVLTQKRLLDTSMYWYDEFVNLRPRDENASIYQFRIADNIRGKVLGLEKEILIEKDEVKKKNQLHQQKKLIYRTIPRYEKIIKNYAGTESERKSNKALGNLYYILKDYLRSGELYLASAPKEPILEKQPALYRSAALSFLKSDDPKKAIDPLDKIIAIIKQENLNNKESAKLLLNAYSLKAWAFIFSGDSETSKINLLKKQLGLGSVALRKATKKTVQLRKELKGAEADKVGQEKNFTEIVSYIESSLLDAKKVKVGKKVDSKLSAKEKSKKAELEKSKNKTLAEAGRKQLKNRLVGEKVQFSSDERSLKIEKNQLKVDYSAATQATSIEKNKLEKISQLIRVLSFDLKRFEREQVRAEKNFIIIGKELASFEKEVKKNKEALKSPEEAERLTAKVNQLSINRRIKECRRKFAKVFEQKQNADITMVVDFKSVTEEQKALETSKNETSKTIKELEHTLQFLLLKKQATDIRYSATKAGIVKNKFEVELFNKQSSKTQAKALKSQKEYLTLIKKSQSLDRGVTDFRISGLKTTIESLTQESTLVQEKAKTLQSKITSITKALDKDKRESLVHLEKFFSKYPGKTENTALNLAKAGTTHIYFKEFEKASVYLNRLQKFYPKHRLVESTTYSLAQAYLEIKRYKDAAKIFSNKIAKKGSLTQSQLRRIQTDTFESALLADTSQVKELLAVSEKAGELYQKMSKNTKGVTVQRERSQFMLGQVSFKQNKYETAIIRFNEILKINPKTSLLFNINMMRGICYREQKLQDLKKAERCFYDIIQYGESQVGSKIYYKTQLELAKTIVTKRTTTNATTAGNILDVVALGINKEKVEMYPIYEELLRDAVYYFALAGNSKMIEKHTSTYKEIFPNGKYTKKITELPKALVVK